MTNLPERLMVRGSTFYCRIWVPRDVVPIYGRQTVVTSLRTKDLKTAKSRLARKSVELEDQFAALRVGTTAKESSLPQGQSNRQSFAEIAREHAVEVSDREFAARATFFRDAMNDPARLWAGELEALPTPADFGHGEDDAYTFFDHLVAEGDLEKVIAYLNRFRLRRRIGDLQRMRAMGDIEAHSEIARSTGPNLDAVELVTLARLLLEEELHALSAIYDGQADASLLAIRAVSTLQANPIVAAGKQEPATPLIVQGGISLDELFERWERETDPSASTLSSWRGIVRNLKSQLGAKAQNVTTIEPEDMVAWKDRLVKSGKSGATITKGYLGCARALFRFAVANKLMTSDPSEGVRVSRKAKAGTKMLAYSREEVGRLLSLAAETEVPWKRWLPWLAAATGARIGELAQLHGSQILEVEGIWVVKIEPAPDAGSIKNPDSERMVPLHSALLDAGVLEFVRTKGQGPLFYSRSSGDPKRKHASKGVATRLASWIRQNGFVDPRKAPNHALRHWFKSEASRVGIPDSLADAIQGHFDGSASSDYRHFYLPEFADAIEKIKLPSKLVP